MNVQCLRYKNRVEQRSTCMKLAYTVQMVNVTVPKRRTAAAALEAADSGSGHLSVRVKGL